MGLLKRGLRASKGYTNDMFAFVLWFLMVFMQILHRDSINVVFGLIAKFAVQSIGQIVISCNISLFSDLA